jgi:N-acetylglucosaminyldiphosphoundecaprenol N-acetyl-beta-D-mannosaminyltransferase
MTSGPISFTPSNRLLCGVPFNANTREEILTEIDHNIRHQRQNYSISITNTEAMYFVLRNAAHAEFVRNTRFSLCDGIGVRLAGFANGVKIPVFHGPDFMQSCCEYGSTRGWRHYFYGGKPGVAERLGERLSSRFPGLIVAGAYTPPFRPGPFEEDPEVLAAIQATRPDMLWVGLGLPKQERWVATHIDKLHIPWMIGVGAAFDYLSGTIQRAPLWIQRMGIEAVYRCFREPPMRLFPRHGRSLIFVGQALFNGLRRPFCADR